MWGRENTQSATLVNLDSPITRAPGLIPIQQLPMIGTRWWEQADRTVIGPTV